MKVLEAARGHGRDDYPVRAVWNSIIAGIVFEHETIASLRRELKRNPALCDICGFEVLKGEGCIPKAGVYSRF
ncbi:transposase, partial [Treponema socranskii]